MEIDFEGKQEVTMTVCLYIQEKRMSKAIEIMLTHVDNLRMSHDRQTTELEEAR